MLRYFFALLLMGIILSCSEDMSFPEQSTSPSEVNNTDVDFRSCTNTWLNFHRGGSNQYIYATVFEELTADDEANPEFSGGYRLPTSCRTRKTPEAVRFNDNVFVYWKGEGKFDGDLWMSTTSCSDAITGDNWTPAFRVLDEVIFDPTTSSAPTAVVWNGTLYLFYVVRNRIICLLSPDGVEFSTVLRMPPVNIGRGIVRSWGCVSVEKLAVTVMNDRLYLFYSNCDDNSIRYITSGSRFDPTGNLSWFSPGFVEGQSGVGTIIGEGTSSGLDATTINDNQLVLTFTGQYSSRVYTKRATVSNPLTGLLNFNSNQWLNGKYSRFPVGIGNDGVNDVFLTYKDGTSTGSSNIDGLKTDICCGGGSSGLTYTDLPVSGSTKDAGTSLVYLSN